MVLRQRVKSWLQSNIAMEIRQNFQQIDHLSRITLAIQVWRRFYWKDAKNVLFRTGKYCVQNANSLFIRFIPRCFMIFSVTIGKTGLKYILIYSLYISAYISIYILSLFKPSKGMKDCDISKYPERFCESAFSIKDGSGFLEVGFQTDTPWRLCPHSLEDDLDCKKWKPLWESSKL